MTTSVSARGCATGPDGALLIGGVSALDLAYEFGTPLHVIDESRLEQRARAVAAAFAEGYSGASRVHFATKCNDTPAVVALVLGAGLSLEVGTQYEWWLARRHGVPAEELVINSPLKVQFLEEAFRDSAGGGLIVLDGLDELDAIAAIAARVGVEPRVLLRVNPNYVPRGMNRATATGSRARSVFGLDPATGEMDEAFTRLRGGPLRYAGLHCHVGSGIRDPRDYRTPIRRLIECAARGTRFGLTTEIIDVGGGIGVPTSRELTTREYLTYHALGRLPAACDAREFPPIEVFAGEIGSAIAEGCARHDLPLPTLVVEPGRAVASGAGFLLVSVARIKERKGVRTWAVTDGGAATVAFPLYYELHDVVHCRTPNAESSRRYDIIGGACHAADWIYRGKELPEVGVGDVLAVCDAGAYFSVQESNFGFAHPAIVGVRDGEARVLRRRESFADMISRDVIDLPRATRTPQQPVKTSALRMRRLGPADFEETIAVFAHGFDGHDLYGPAMGLDHATFGDYFRTLLPVALADPKALVLGAEWESKLAAVLIAGRPGFPTFVGGLRHVYAFARAAGWAKVPRYLRFVFALDYFMHRPAAERKTEFRGMWLAAKPDVSGRRAGSFLVREACEYSRRLGYPLQAAVVDGDDRRLVAFYERHGFRITRRSHFLGGRAVRMEHRFALTPALAEAGLATASAG